MNTVPYQFRIEPDNLKGLSELNDLSIAKHINKAIKNYLEEKNGK